MRLLLDTHVAIWSVTVPDRLPGRIRDIIAAGEEHWVSYASIWELAVKSAPGRRSPAPMLVHEAITQFGRAGLKLLEIKLPHIQATAELPLLHRDPFDRLIVAQAISEPLRLITHDGQLAAYSDAIIHW